VSEPQLSGRHRRCDHSHVVDRQDRVYGLFSAVIDDALGGTLRTGEIDHQAFGFKGRSDGEPMVGGNYRLGP
jgi:hypothetical protein